MINNRRHSCFLKAMVSAFCLLNSAFLFSQDIHFSNWNMSPLNVNSANAGMFDGDGRLIFNYRNQWKTVKVPYNTLSFGGDFNLKKSLVKGTEEAVGIILNHDGAGDGNYKITDVKIPISHKLSFIKDTTLTIAIGIMPGITSIGINSNNLSYDKQWDGDAYNEGLANGENFARQNKIFADVSLGTVIQKQINQKIKVNVGYSLNHLNKPNISFYNTPGVVLRPRHMEQVQVQFSFNNISSIMLEYYGQQQQAFKENLVGLSYYYTIDPKSNTILNVGVLSRLGDAFITTLGLQYNNMRLQASYDYNYSQFKKATNGRGAFEISLIYIYARPKLFVPKTRVCPVYM